MCDTVMYLSEPLIVVLMYRTAAYILQSPNFSTRKPLPKVENMKANFYFLSHLIIIKFYNFF